MKKYLLTMLAVLAGSNMWAQSFSYDKSNKTLTISVTTDLSNDNAAAGKVQNKMAEYQPETVIVNGGGKINRDFIKAILYNKNSWESELSYSVPNKDTKTLDLGGVVLVDWSTTTFQNKWGNIDSGIKIKTLTLPKTPNNEIPDEPFIGKSSDHQFWPIEQIVIPDGCVRIGAYFTKNMSNLTTVKWPDTVKEIGDMAFAHLTKWDIPALPKKLEIIGNSAFALTNIATYKTITFPSSVKIICPGAFLFRQYQEVYFQSKTAPLLPLGESLIQPGYGNMTAFGAETLMGNNGFTHSSSKKYADDFTKGKANRENYVSSTGAYFAILHFPKSLTDDEKATYTDINKKYETWNDTDGKFYQAATKVVGQETSTLKYGNYTVNNQVNPGYKDTYVGEDYIWPSQTQWMRSFLTATNGVCWDGVTHYTPVLSDEQIALLRKVGFSETEYNDEALAKIAHVGTRQFVLTADDATETPDFPLPISEGGRWWTLCVPFNMTKKMVDDAMGQGTQVCRFSSVTRKLDTDGQGRGDGNKGNHIYLEFRHDVYKYKFERSADGTFHDDEWSEDLPDCEDNDIVIYAHEPYMVKPTKTDKDAVKAVFVVDDYEPVPGSPLPTIIKATETSYKNNTLSQADNENAGEYRFIGNYINTAQKTAVSVPVNCYFYGLAKASDTKPAFWFWPYNSHLTWPSYKCTVETVNVELGEQDARDFFNFVAGFSASSKYQSSFFGDDELYSNETTSVDQVVIVAGDDDQAIYNLSGQLVSKNGNLDGLQKGVYVKGGKKFIVK